MAQKIYKGSSKEGFFISSNCGLGDELAIRMEHVETNGQCSSFSFSPGFAKRLGKMLIEVAEDYENGIETGD